MSVWQRGDIEAQKGMLSYISRVWVPNLPVLELSINLANQSSQG